MRMRIITTINNKKRSRIKVEEGVQGHNREIKVKLAN